MDKNNIATLADSIGTKDSNKAAIWSIVNRLLNSGDRVLTDNDLAAMYKYFSPSIPAKPKTDAQWVAKAIANKDVRYYLNYIYSDGSRIMATDGHKLHIAHAEYEAGFYDKNMNKVECDGKFPDVSRVIPDNLPNSAPFSEWRIEDASTGGKCSQYYTLDGIYLDSEYVKKAVSGFDNPIIKYSDNISCVVIEDGHRMAVIMPVRMPK